MSEPVGPARPAHIREGGPVVTDPATPAGELTMKGPGLWLIEARNRIRLAVLAIIAGEAGACIDMPWTGSPACERSYAELAAAAKELGGICERV